MPPTPKLTQADILQIIRQLVLETQTLRRALSRCEERAASVLSYLGGLEKTLATACQPALTGAGAQGFKLPGAGMIALPPHGSEVWSILEGLADAGIARLEIQSRADGSALVQVEDGKAFKLPPRLAQLLAILAQDSGPAKGALVGWKSPHAVGAALEKQFGRPFRKPTVTQLIHRLRQVFYSHGLNPCLVHSDPQLGMRFALQRKKPV